MAEIFILDGGLGTSLEQRYKVQFSPSKPLWSADLLLSDPETLQRCQSDFGQIPTDILLTATYQISVEGFNKTKTDEFPEGVPTTEIPTFLEVALRIGEAAASSKTDLAFSVGPYGACMIPSQEYSGKYDEQHDSEESLFEWHKTRLCLFSGISHIGSRIKLFALETIPRKDEILALRRAMAATPLLKSLPFWMSCLFPGDEANLPDGSTAKQAVEAMLDCSTLMPVPWGIGINCTKVWKLEKLLHIYEGTVQQMLDDGKIQQWPALVLYPDGTNGEVYNTETQQWEKPETVSSSEIIPWEDQLADIVEATRARGKWKTIVVGGCCMADCDDIAKLRQRLLK